MSRQGQITQEMPPADAAGFHDAMARPFADPDSPKGAVVGVQYPHTAADEAANRMLAHGDSIDAMSAGDDSERRGLAAHQPRVEELPLGAYPDATAPAQVTTSYGRQEEDVVAEHSAAGVNDEKWDSFVAGHRNADPQAPRRGRVSGLIRRAFRSGRQQ